MGLVMSHTYNLSHTYLSHTPHTVKHPTSVALSIGIHIALCTSNVRQAVIAKKLEPRLSELTF